MVNNLGFIYQRIFFFHLNLFLLVALIGAIAIACQ